MSVRELLLDTVLDAVYLFVGGFDCYCLGKNHYSIIFEMEIKLIN